MNSTINAKRMETVLFLILGIFFSSLFGCAEKDSTLHITRANNGDDSSAVFKMIDAERVGSRDECCTDVGQVAVQWVLLQWV